MTDTSGTERQTARTLPPGKRKMLATALFVFESVALESYAGDDSTQYAIRDSVDNILIAFHLVDEYVSLFNSGSVPGHG